MIWRTFDDDTVDRAIDQVRDELKGIPPSFWLEDENNIALTNDNGDVSLFEYRRPGVYTGHYFFLCRGKDAVKAAQDFLDEIFRDVYDVRVLIGMTPLKKKGALWMSRRIGFSTVGEEIIDGEPHRIFVLTKKDHNG